MSRHQSPSLIQLNPAVIPFVDIYPLNQLHDIHGYIDPCIASHHIGQNQIMSIYQRGKATLEHESMVPDQEKDNSENSAAILLGKTYASRLQPDRAGVLSPSPLAISRSNCVHHSPPYRTCHKSIIVSPVAQFHSLVLTPSRGGILRERLSLLQTYQKDILKNYKDCAAKMIAKSRLTQQAWDHPDANQHLPEIYAAELEMQDLQREYHRWGRDFVTVAEEIEELLGDIMVPHESRPDVVMASGAV